MVVIVKPTTPQKWKCGKIQSSSTLVNDAGMVAESPEDPDLKPERVEVVQSGDVAKAGKY